MLDLIVEYRPCPSARYGYSDQLATRTSGVRTIPYFVDPSNTIAQLGSISDYEKIVEYLFDNFGPGSENIPKQLQGKISGNAASYTGGAGGKLITNYKQDNIFKKPIDVWGFESSPTLRPVRETLCGLALAHRMVHCAKGSQREGKQQVPYIEDPNTGKKISGSVEIVKYLLAQYTTQ
jgi:Glutathione S-transferase, N-terminal domain